MTCPKSEQNASGGEHVQGGGVGCRLYRLPHTTLQNIGTELERRGDSSGRSQRRPWRRPRARMIAHNQCLEAARLQPTRQRRP